MQNAHARALLIMHVRNPSCGAHRQHTETAGWLLARCTMSNPAPADLGCVWRLDPGAQEPRPRRQDEVTAAGEETQQDYFVIMPAVGVSRSARWTHS